MKQIMFIAFALSIWGLAPSVVEAGNVSDRSDSTAHTPPAPGMCRSCEAKKAEKSKLVGEVLRLSSFEQKNSERLKHELDTSKIIKINSNLLLLRLDKETAQLKIGQLETELKECGVCDGERIKGKK